MLGWTIPTCELFLDSFERWTLSFSLATFRRLLNFRTPSYKFEEIELILFFKSSIIQIFVHQNCMNSLFDIVNLVESYKL